MAHSTELWYCVLAVALSVSGSHVNGCSQAIKALTAALAPKARAFRDGKLEQIDASGLVPGDVILMAIGNIVPADVKLMGEEGDDIPMQVCICTAHHYSKHCVPSDVSCVPYCNH